MKSYILEEENRKYLVYEPDNNDTLDKVAMGMLENNEIDGLIPFTINGIDDKIIVRYDVTGLSQFSEMLGDCLKKEKILDVLEQVLDVYSEVEKYLIESESIILDYEKIFYNKENGKLFFVVSPVAGKNTGNPELKVFLKNYICQVRFDSTENCDYIGKMLGYLNSSSDFSVTDFKYILDSQFESKHQEAMPEKITVSESDEIHVPEYTIKKPQYEEEPEEKFADIASEVIDEPENDPEQSFKIPLDSFADDEDDDENKSKKGLFSMFFKEKDSKNKNRSRKKDDDGDDKFKIDFCDKDGEIISEMTDENATVCIRGNHGKEKASFLLRIKNNERIFIKKNNFKIGTEKKSVDYCITDNTAVSRMHAKIVKKNDIYFIVDNNSTNHTYLNDHAIKENFEMRLQDKSRIKLADEEFVFYM